MGQTLDYEYWQPLLDERFERSGTQFVPHDQRDWDADHGTWFVPERPTPVDPDAWHPADALVVTLRHSDGELLGMLSVNEPGDGRRPTDKALEVLAAFGAQIAQTIESAEEATSITRHGAALEHLFFTSSELMRGHSREAVLRLVCEGVCASLGFGLAVVELADSESDRYRPVAAAGIDLESNDLELPVGISELDRIFEPQFEVEGCYLLTREEALARVPNAASLTFSSSQNGLGPRAWRHHWLIVPLYDRGGEMMGFIWADDPADRLLPSRERLQTLRLFANQASTALENAAQLDALRKAHATQAALVDSSPIAIGLLDAEGRIQAVNRAAEELFGWSAEEVVGREAPWIPPTTRDAAGERLRRVLSGEQLRFEAVDLKRDGSTVDVIVSAAPLAGSGDAAGVVTTYLDVTDRNRIAESLARRNAELEALQDTALDLMGRLDPHAVLETILARACALLRTEHGNVWLADEDGRELVATIGLGLFAPFVGDVLSTDEGMVGLAFTTGRQHTTDDYAANEAKVERHAVPELRAGSCVPLVSGGRTVGVLGVAFSEPGRTLTAHDEALLERFGRMASLALEKARLYETARKNEELYRRVLETSTDLISLVSSEGTIVFASPSSEALLGYAPDELVGTSYRGLVHPDDLAGAAGTIEAAFAGRQPQPYLGRARHRDGRWIQMEGVPAPIFDDDGNVEMILTVARDVTERLRHESELRESRELYRSVVENANDLIALIDVDGYLRYASPSHEQVLGFTPDELVGMHVTETCHSEDLQDWTGAIDEVVESGRSTWGLRVRHKNGQWVILEGSSKAIPGPDGKPRLILSTSRDVTQQRALEEQLRGAQKMEAVGQLAGGIAHDFNNLLTAIDGYGDFALQQLPADSPVRRHVAEMKRAGERAASLTKQLLAFSRRQVLQPKVVDLNEVVGGMEEMLRRLIGEDVHLITSLAADLGRTKADPSQLEQVVMNLAVNARDAMPRGGELRIETANVELDDAFAETHVGARAGSHVALIVTDTGEGMDRETLDHVFEPFFTTKPAGQGTGLGLSTVYGIVKQTDGSIWAYSEPGRGTTFKVYLPRIWETAAAPEEQRPRPARSGSGTILLVEDEGIVRELVAEMLDAAGYTVLAAADGPAAIELADAHAGRIDALMTDVVMPGMSGQEVAARLTEQRPGLRVLFTSGYTEDAISNHGVLRPGAAFLEKPFTAAQLGETLHALLRERLAA
jgi:PAS domain S-box-containing protein